MQTSRSGQTKRRSWASVRLCRWSVAMHEACGRSDATTHGRVLYRAVFELRASSSLEHISHGIEVMPMQIILC